MSDDATTTAATELWPGQVPGVHDHKPYDECPQDCPGRLAADTPYTVKVRKPVDPLHPANGVCLCGGCVL